MNAPYGPWMTLGTFCYKKYQSDKPPWNRRNPADKDQGENSKGTKGQTKKPVESDIDVEKRTTDQKKHIVPRKQQSSTEDKFSGSRFQIQPFIVDAQVIFKKIQSLAGPETYTIYTSPAQSSWESNQNKKD